MKDNCFTILCWFLSYINMNQPQIYICSFPLEPPSDLPPHPTHWGCHRALAWAPCAIQRLPISHLFYAWLVLLSCSVVSDSLWPLGLQHVRLPCPSLSPGVCSNSCPSSWWCSPTISSSVTPFSSCLQSFPESGSFPVSQFFISASQSIVASASASVLPMNIQGWFTHNEAPFSLSCPAPSNPSQLEALTPSAYAVTGGPRVNPADSRHIQRATANHQVTSRLSFCSWFSRQRTVYLHDHHVSALSMLVSIFFHGFLGPTIPTGIIEWLQTLEPAI